MPTVFEPFAIGPLTLRNRILRAATHEGMADPDGDPASGLATLYRRLQDSGAGGLITGCIAISADSATLPHMCVLDSDRRIGRWQQAYAPVLTAERPPVIAQLVHGGGQALGPRPLAPSRHRYRPRGHIAHAMTETDIEHVIQSFADAIRRARDIGFAAAQLHAAHGYLLAEFLSPRYNRRTDRWGGDPAARFRIVGEILGRAHREAQGFPVLAKISAYSFSPGDSRVEDAVRAAVMLEEAGCAALEVSCGSGEDGFSTIRCPRVPSEAVVALLSRFRRMPAPARAVARLFVPLAIRRRRPLHNYNVAAARAVKTAVRIPVIVTGGIRTLEDISGIVERGDADCVSLCRPFVAEPGIVKRFREGQKRSRCTDCCWCMIGAIEHPLRCYRKGAEDFTAEDAEIAEKNGD